MHILRVLLRWKNTLLIPFIAALASGSLLIVHAISSSRSSQRHDTSEELNSTTVAADEDTRSNWFGRKINEHAYNHGGLVIFAFKIVQLLGCLTLLSLSLATLLLDSGHSIHHGLMFKLDWDRFFLVDNLSQIAMAFTFVSFVAINFPYNVLKRRPVVYLRPCYNLSRSDQLEPIFSTSQ